MRPKSEAALEAGLDDQYFPVPGARSIADAGPDRAA